MNIEPLLALIRKYESADDYTRVWSGIKRHDHPPKKLTDMTVREVLSWQDGIDAKYMSEAAGAYQIMEDTLRGMVISGAADMDERFHRPTQDRLAEYLMNRRGLREYLNGEITPHEFANRLAYEWASLPVTTGPRKGYSQYAGDGLNKAHVSPDEVLAAVRAVKGKAQVEAIPSKPTFSLSAIIQQFIRAIIEAFRGKA